MSEIHPLTWVILALAVIGMVLPPRPTTLSQQVWRIAPLCADPITGTVQVTSSVKVEIQSRPPTSVITTPSSEHIISGIMAQFVIGDNASVVDVWIEFNGTQRSRKIAYSTVSAADVYPFVPGFNSGDRAFWLSGKPAGNAHTITLLAQVQAGQNGVNFSNRMMCITQNTRYV